MTYQCQQLGCLLDYCVGRELAIASMNSDYKFKYVFPLIGKDFLKMTIRIDVCQLQLYLQFTTSLFLTIGFKEVRQLTL